MILMDTHIFIWFMSGDTKLNDRDNSIITNAQQNGIVALSAISIWELSMLDKHRKIIFNKSFDMWLREATEGIKIIDINYDISLESTRLPDFEHKDPADRFIISTARICNAKLITKDKKIIDYAERGYVDLA